MSVPTNSEYQKVYVYEGAWGKLSALVVTSSGEVFGSGGNSLVFTDTKDLNGRYCMIEGVHCGSLHISSCWVQIDKLCGRGIKKIVTGYESSAAITDAGELLVWGPRTPDLVDQSALLTLQTYRPNIRCKLCVTTHDYAKKSIGKAALNYCEVTQTHPVYSPSDDLPVMKCVKYDAKSGVRCSRCGLKCSSTATIVNSAALCYCKSCDLPEDLNAGIVQSETTGKFLKRVRLSEKIVDVGEYLGLWILTITNVLTYAILLKEEPHVLPLVRNPDNVKMTAVHCYRRGTFVTSHDGGVYKCQQVASEPAVYYILEKVPLPAAVTKVRCGFDAVGCLLSNNWIYILSDQHPPQRLICDDGTDTFLDIAAVHWQDTFFIQTNKPSVLKSCHPITTLKIKFELGESDCNKRLVETVCRKPLPTGPLIDINSPRSASTSQDQSLPGPSNQPGSASTCEDQSLPGPSNQPGSASLPSNSSTLPPFQSGLYGQAHLSDITLKLKDGDFPAHRCILMTNSAYFNKTFSPESDTSNQTVLNFSSYNPSIFKCLLKYFYQQPQDELDLDGLFDFLQLANVFGETILVRHIEEKIKAKVNVSNALQTLALSKLFEFDQIEKHCENIIRTAEFKDWLIGKALKNPTIFLVLPNTD